MAGRKGKIKYSKSKRSNPILFLAIVLFMIFHAQNIYGVKTVQIPMRDGVKLATELYFPEKGKGPSPVILMRTPYNKNILKGYGDMFSGQGYVLAAQDVRGRSKSGGKWEPFINEGQDGYDTIEWLAAQDWSTGKIGMYGGSYSGTAQFNAAILKPPHLVTLIPNIFPAMPFGNMPYEGGLLVMGGNIRWLNIVENSKTAADMQEKARETYTKDWFDLLGSLPVIDLDKKILGKKNPYWRRWIRHYTNDSYWKNVNYLEGLKTLDIPVFIQSGWFDPGNRGTKLAYAALKQSKNKNIKMIMGPWAHTDQSSRYLHGQDFGADADIGLMSIYSEWFDYWLKGKDNGITNKPLVQVFNVGTNNWLKANTYPLPGTIFTKYYLTSEKGANTSRGDGKLQLSQSSSKKKFDFYNYDPGNLYRCFTEHLKKGLLEKYREIVASRQDILVYETPPLEEPLTITGPVSAKLYASSSAKDTDWCIILYAVNGDGEIYPMGMTWGVLRARFRNSMIKPEPLKKDKIYEFTIDLSHTGVTLAKGERIRMEISSSFFPEYSRNLNTGGRNETETKYVTAAQRIYHTPEYPSHVLLPVIKQETLKTLSVTGKEQKVQPGTVRYAAYTGSYTNSRLGDVRVSEHNNMLAVAIPKLRTLPFNAPDEKGIWYFRFSKQLYVTFMKDDSGKVTGMTICEENRMGRVTGAEVSYEEIPEKYKPIVGKYLFRTQGIQFEITVQDGSLLLKEPKEATFPLEFSKEKDLWESKNGDRLVKFEYESDGSVKGIITTHVSRLSKK